MIGIKVTELKRDEVSKELANKYFVTENGMALDRFHLPKLDAETYNVFMAEVKAGASDKDMSKIKEHNFSYSTATDYYKDKVQKLMVAKDFKVDPKYVDFRDYIKDERFYEYFDTNIQICFYNMEYMTPSARDYSDTKREEYNTCNIDVDAFNRLWKFCTVCVLQHKAMMCIKVDKAIQLMNRIVKDTHGFSTNTTAAAAASLKSYIKFFEELLKDKEFKEYLKTHTDADMYAECESTRSDFIDTYVKLYESIGYDFTETELFEKYATPEDIECLNITFTSYEENSLDDNEGENYEEEEESSSEEIAAEEA